MSYLCDYVSLLPEEKKKTPKQQAPATRGAFFSPRRARVGLVFILKRRLGGDGGGSKPTPSAPSKHKTDEKKKKLRTKRKRSSAAAASCDLRKQRREKGVNYEHVRLGGNDASITHGP